MATRPSHIDFGAKLATPVAAGPLPASAHLDLARAIAAQIVVLGHIRVLFLADYPDLLTKPGLFVKGLYWICGLQHEAVIVFFVLSGLLISRNIVQKRERGTWAWREYLTDRLVRLYVVLIPGLFLGLVWDGMGSNLLSSRWLYAEPLARFTDVPFVKQLTPGAFIGNLTFLQTISVPAFGSNLPLWSLACEFWYYLLFPLLLFGCLAWTAKGQTIGVRLRRSAGFLFAAGLVLWLIGPEKTAWFVIWLFGFAVWLVDRQVLFSAKVRSALIYVGALLLLATLALARTHLASLWVSDFSVGAAFGFLVLGLLRNEHPSSALYARAAGVAAGFSYSEYVVTFPFMVFLRAALFPHERAQPDAWHLLSGLIVFAACVIYAFLFSLATESHTQRVKQWIRRKSAKSPSRGDAWRTAGSFSDSNPPVEARVPEVS